MGQQDHALLQARHAVARQARRHHSSYDNPKLESNLDSCPWDGSGGPSSHAGCFVVHGNKLLVVELISGEFSIPGGSYRYGEAPACTAWRETVEETGYEVEPQVLIRKLSDVYQLWQCNLTDAGAQRGSGIIDRSEVRRPLWLTGDEMSDLPWRYPDQLALYQDLLADLAEEEPRTTETTTLRSTETTTTETQNSTASTTPLATSTSAPARTTQLPTEMPEHCPYDGHDEPSHAGCFVVNGSGSNVKALFVEEWTGKLNLPGGGKLHREAPQCTAWRRTWQETGFLATPDDNLMQFGSFIVFECSLYAHADVSLDGGAGFDPTVRRVVWLGSEELSAHSWRFPEQVPVFRSWLEDLAR